MTASIGFFRGHNQAVTLVSMKSDIEFCLVMTPLSRDPEHEFNPYELVESTDWLYRDGKRIWACVNGSNAMSSFFDPC